jgi:aldose sugar dehydrogenase
LVLVVSTTIDFKSLSKRAFLVTMIVLLALQAITYTLTPAKADPVVNDPSLKLELITKEINFPTSMAFLGPDDILILEKNQGTVRRIVNGNMLPEPLLDVNVANKAERGMLGIAITQHESKDGDKPKDYVFLYYTETKSKDGEDLEKDGSILGNRLYRYELENNKLVNPKLLLDLPAEPGADHQGGVVLIGPDKNMYLVIGDVNHFNEAQNMLDRKAADGSSGILRITQDGKVIQHEDNLGNIDPLSKYYAYGIRNSFGMDFDPVTGNLWDTENGIDCCDEINLVKQGFNSGWAQVQGIWELNQSDRTYRLGVFDQASEKQKLVDFNGKGKYSDPEFIWKFPVGPSALKFLDSDKLGKQYMDGMFVGDVNTQNIYHFDLTKDRTQLFLNNSLKDKIADKVEELDDVIFAKALGRITDIEVGPDGNLYIVSHSWSDDPLLRIGTIFKISKK